MRANPRQRGHQEIWSLGGPLCYLGVLVRQLRRPLRKHEKTHGHPLDWQTQVALSKWRKEFDEQNSERYCRWLAMDLMPRKNYSLLTAEFRKFESYFAKRSNSCLFLSVSLFLCVSLSAFVCLFFLCQSVSLPELMPLSVPSMWWHSCMWY